MKLTNAAVTTLVVLVASGCASLQVRTDFDQSASFEQFTTYEWVGKDLSAAGDPVFDSPLFSRRLLHAVDSALGSIGYRRVDSGEADFRVSYSVSTEEKVDVSYTAGSPYGYGAYYTNPYYGYGGSYGFGNFRSRRLYLGLGLYGLGSYYRYSPTYAYAGTYAREYVEGTLVVDVADAATGEVVWRGWASKNLGREPEPDEVRVYVNEAVAKILAEFPAGSKPTGSLVAPDK
jgi:hypothetical protein